MLNDIKSLPCVNVSEKGRYSFDGCTIIYCLSINTCEEMNLEINWAIAKTQTLGIYRGITLCATLKKNDRPIRLHVCNKILWIPNCMEASSM